MQNFQHIRVAMNVCTIMEQKLIINVVMLKGKLTSTLNDACALGMSRLGGVRIYQLQHCN